MPEGEPRGNHLENPENRLEKEERAEYYLDFFNAALNDAENNETENGLINLEAPSSHPDAQLNFKGDPPSTTGDVLESLLPFLEEYINYLNPEQRRVADDLIVKAKLYLSARDSQRV